MIIKTEITIRVPVDIDRLRSWLTAHGYHRSPVPCIRQTERWTRNPTAPPSWEHDIRLPPDTFHPDHAAAVLSRAISHLAHIHHLTENELADQIARTSLNIQEPML